MKNIDEIKYNFYALADTWISRMKKPVEDDTTFNVSAINDGKVVKDVSVTDKETLGDALYDMANMEGVSQIEVWVEKELIGTMDVNQC